MALAKVRPLGSGFLIFSDYARPAIRLAAMMEIPVDLRLHARLDRRRRGRPDAPADRAARVAAGDPRPDRAPPGRRQRGRRGLEGGHDSSPRAGRPGPHPPGRADARPHQVRARPRACAAAATSWPTPPDGKPDVILMATGSEVALCVDAYEKLTAEGDQGPRRQHAVAGSSSTTRTRRTATRSCRPRSRARVVGRAGLDLRLGPVRRPEGAMVGMHTFGPRPR